MLRKGSGPRVCFTQAGPVDCPGNSFCSRAPDRCARNISVGVAQPGIIATPSSPAAAMTSSSTTGETRKRAPASTASAASSRVTMVPAPTIKSSRAENSRMRSRTLGMEKVNSITRNPPSTAAFIAWRALSESLVRRMAEARHPLKAERNSSGFIIERA